MLWNPVIYFFSLFYLYACYYGEWVSAQLCLTLCNPMDCSPQGRFKRLILPHDDEAVCSSITEHCLSITHMALFSKVVFPHLKVAWCIEMNLCGFYKQKIIWGRNGEIKQCYALLRGCGCKWRHQAWIWAVWDWGADLGSSEFHFCLDLDLGPCAVFCLPAPL